MNQHGSFLRIESGDVGGFALGSHEAVAIEFACIVIAILNDGMYVLLLTVRITGRFFLNNGMLSAWKEDSISSSRK